ncbi:MAG: class I SAM-dependent DNA methyltransferase [Planctomycetia bacterium]|nr:class I SAM-dependent DNA methyltransferase [Planctomycetia bacterium]
MSDLSSFTKRIRDIMRQDSGVQGDAQRIEQLSWMLFMKIYDAKEEDWELDGYESIIPPDLRWRYWGANQGGKGMTGGAFLDFVNNTLFPRLRGLQVTSESPVKHRVVKNIFQDAHNYMKDGVLLRQVANEIDAIPLESQKDTHAFGEVYETILRLLQSAGSSGEFYTPRAVTDFMVELIDPQIGEKMADFACGTGGFLTSWLKALRPKALQGTTGELQAWNESVYGMEKKSFPYQLCVANMLLHDLDEPNIEHGNSLAKKVLDYTDADRFDVILMNPPYGGSEKEEIKRFFPSDLQSSETADLFMSVIMYRLKEKGRAGVVLPDGFLFGTDSAKLQIKKKLLSEFNLHTIIRLPASVFAPYTSITTNLLFFNRDGATKETQFYRLDMPEGYKHFSKTKPILPEHFDPVREWLKDRRPIVADGFDKARTYTAQELVDRNYNLDLCGYPHKEEEILPPKDLILEYQEKRASLNADIDHILEKITAVLGINLND